MVEHQGGAGNAKAGRPICETPDCDRPVWMEGECKCHPCRGAWFDKGAWLDGLHATRDAEKSRFDRLEALLPLASPGPWKVRPCLGGEAAYYVDADGVEREVMNNEHNYQKDTTQAQGPTGWDFEFLVALRNEAKALLARARRFDRLKEYAQHQMGCDFRGREFAQSICSCGLDDLLKEEE